MFGGQNRSISLPYLKPAEVPNNPTTELDLTLFIRTEATATKAICAPVIDSCVVLVLTPFGMLT